MRDASETVLPFALDALTPAISARALATHREEQQRVVDTVQRLAKSTALDGRALHELATTSGDALAAAATHAWAHEFFWRSLTARRTAPQATLEMRIEAAFGSVNGLKHALCNEAMKLDGPGWLWLVSDDRCALRLLTTPGSGVALWQAKERPLFAIDLWEHAYAIDYGDDRCGYVAAVFELINWDVVGARLGLFASGSG
jgi:superoxide dismutase, Fe-Mn family